MLKKLRIGFAAVIALLALTATVASHAGVFSSKIAKAAVDNGCYTLVENLAGQTFQSGDPASTPLPTVKDIKQTPIGSRVLNPTPEGDCPDPSDIICCVQVVNDQISSFVFGTLQ